MKGIMVGLMGVMVLSVAGWRLVDKPAAPEQVSGSEPARITVITDVAGSWYSFPVGLAIRIDEDGTVYFGLDGRETPIGYEAQAEFEGKELIVHFTNYDGPSEACRIAAGKYQVYLLEGGTIRFMPVQDDCQFRLEALSGRTDADLELAFHPVTW